MALLALIPGGPGLTTDSLAELKAAFEPTSLIALDPPTASSDWSYHGLFEIALSQLPKNSDVVLCGHSFGGILAAEIALRSSNVKGLICMASPFSETAWESVGKQYESHLTPELKLVADAFDREPNNENFREWIANYGEMYFTRGHADAGREMLRRSRTNLNAYKGAGEEASKKGHLLKELSALQMPKLYLRGELDKLVTPETAIGEADAGGFVSIEIKGASHFMAFDRPTETIDAIKSFLKATSLKGES